MLNRKKGSTCMSARYSPKRASDKRNGSLTHSIPLLFSDRAYGWVGPPFWYRFLMTCDHPLPKIWASYSWRTDTIQFVFLTFRWHLWFYVIPNSPWPILKETCSKGGLCTMMTLIAPLQSWSTATIMVGWLHTLQQSCIYSAQNTRSGTICKRAPWDKSTARVGMSDESESA